MRARYAGGVTVILLVTACGGSSDAVQWDDYAPGLQARIDQETHFEECDILQNELHDADANSDATVARTGHDSARLMKYVQAAQRKAGCLG